MRIIAGKSASNKSHQYAPLFAALGDGMRLYLVAKLTAEGARSISELSAGTRMSRQAITKHLRVLESVGLVDNLRVGRESIFQLNPKPLETLKVYLDLVSRQWGQSIARFSSQTELKE